MNQGSSRKYNKHIFTRLDDIVYDLHNYGSRDGILMYEALKPIISILRNNGINQLHDITLTFKNCGFNNKNTNQILIFLVDHLPMIKLSKRIINKLNNSYRNIIFNFIFLEFPNQILQLIDDFISSHCNEIHNHDFLMSKLEQLIRRKPPEVKIKMAELNDETSHPIIQNDIAKENICINDTAKITNDNENKNQHYLYFKEECNNYEINISIKHITV